VSETYRRDSGPKHEGAANTSPYPTSRLAPTIELVDVARRIAQADHMLGSVVGGKLETIARQIRALQDEAALVLEQAERDVRLHHARCDFVRKPGRLYHLYRKAEDQLYFSMLSPGDWGGSPPHAFEGSYRLEADLSWTPAEQIASRDAEVSELRGLLPRGD
jgi:hypothetical protein